MKTQAKNNQAGFTLIEYIIALVIAAIVAAMIYSYMGSALILSSDPIFRLQKVSNLSTVMENIVADHNRLNKINLRYKWRSNTAYSIGDFVLPSNGINNATSTIDNTRGRYYKCTQAGISKNALPLPSWTTTSIIPSTGGVEFTDGTVKWKEWGYVWNASTSYPANSTVVLKYSNGHYYKGPASPNPFTSGTSEPTHLTGGISDGNVTWTEAGTILDRNTGLTDAILLDSIKYYLDTYLTTNVGRYGTDYAVVSAETKFIQFNGSTEVDAGTNGTSSEKNILKVTIKSNDTGETLTQLFTIR